MSERMKKEVEENNAKPSFFLQSASKASITNQAIYLQGRSKYNEANGTMSTSLSTPLCYLTEYVANPKEIVALLVKGEMHDELISALHACKEWFDNPNPVGKNPYAAVKEAIQKAELLS